MPWARRGNGFTDRFPQIARACEKLPPDALMNGEMIAVDDSGKVCFTRVAAQPFRSKNRNVQHI